jgi:hypothetical protein
LKIYTYVMAPQPRLALPNLGAVYGGADEREGPSCETDVGVTNVTKVTLSSSSSSSTRERER